MFKLFKKADQEATGVADKAEALVSQVQTGDAPVGEETAPADPKASAKNPVPAVPAETVPEKDPVKELGDKLEGLLAAGDEEEGILTKDDKKLDYESSGHIEEAGNKTQDD